MVGVLEKAVGPAVWSIAEVNLGRVTVPFVSLSLSPHAARDDSQHFKQIYAMQENPMQQA